MKIKGIWNIKRSFNKLFLIDTKELIKRNISYTVTKVTYPSEMRAVPARHYKNIDWIKLFLKLLRKKSKRKKLNER